MINPLSYILVLFGVLSGIYLYKNHRDVSSFENALMLVYGGIFSLGTILGGLILIGVTR